MKNLFLLFLALFLSYGSLLAQNEELEKGNLLIETNTGLGAFGNNSVGLGNTGFAFLRSNGASYFSIGGDVGYFVIDRLALKLGLGFSGGSEDAGVLNVFNYKVGAKYYIIDKIPAELSFTGSRIENFNENPIFMGLQSGYAIFFANNKVSIEPGFRYNISLNNDFYEDFFQLNVGFTVHL